MTIALLFCSGDLNAAMSTPTGFPFIEIYRNATNSVGGAIAMVSLPPLFHLKSRTDSYRPTVTSPPSSLLPRYSVQLVFLPQPRG
jgi:hypothetical protein